MELITKKGDIELYEVKSKADLGRFIKFPFSLYKNDPNWVPPLISERKVFFDTKKNPFYRSAKTRLILARRRKEFVGRIAICINYKHNEFHQEKAGFFGFFDVIEDYQVAELLLKVALIWIKKEGMEKILGPCNFSTNHEIGMLLEGYDSPPVVMMTYNKPYYHEFVERFGLKKEKDLLAYVIDRKADIDPRLRHVFERMKARNGVTLRTLNVWRFDAEVDLINDLYNRAWTYNWGFVPLSKEEFQHIARDMKQILDPDMVFIAEVNGQPVGFCLSLPNINQALKYVKNGRLFPTGLLKILWHTKIKNKIDSVRVITMGVVPEFQKRGIDTLFYIQTFDVGSRKGYQWAELSWLLEDNEMILRALDHMGGKPYKKYRLYGMRI